MRQSLLVSVLAGSFILTGTSTALAREKASPPASVLQSQATASSFDATDCITCHEPAVAKMKAYEKYDFKDAYASGNLLMPQSVFIFLKANDGNYKANVVYGKLSYRF